jgi:PPOX class probable F420-dependent enzyme
VPVLDTTTPAGRRAAERLRDELIAWLVTVRPDGQPQPSPVWFLWQDPDVLVYSQPGTGKLRALRQHPRVALHLDGNGQGGDVVVLEGSAELDPSAPAADANPEYLGKYEERIRGNGWTPEGFAADYSVALRIRPQRARVW